MLCYSSVVLAQNVTIRAVDQPAATIFGSIVEQTGKNFVYSSDLLKNMNVTVNVKDKPLKHTLSIMFKNSDIEWKIKGKNIILKKRVSKNKQKPKAVRPDRTPAVAPPTVAPNL